MSTKITFVGLGQIGSSMGLALAPYKEKITRVGHDADARLMKNLEKEGAFDKTETKLLDAVRGADLVIMDYPADLVRDGLSIIAKEVKPETIIIAISLVSKVVYEWARELLPAKQPFIVLQPVIHPDRLADWDDTLLTPHADLFENCDMIITTDVDTQPRAVQMATDLCSLIKAKPYFTEPMEADGIIAGVEQLPKLTAVALLSTLLNSPGWGDARHFTSRAFFRTASISMLYDEQEFFGITSLMNKENTTRVLDEMIAELKDMRRMVNEEDEEGLRKTLKDAREGYTLWLDQRTSGEWDREKKPAFPASQNMMGRLFGGRPPRENDVK